MFEPYLKSFYIRSTDPTQIKVLKVTLKLPWWCWIKHRFDFNQVMLRDNGAFWNVFNMNITWEYHQRGFLITSHQSTPLRPCRNLDKIQHRNWRQEVSNISVGHLEYFMIMCCFIHIKFIRKSICRVLCSSYFCSWRFWPIWPMRPTSPPFSGSFRYCDVNN